MAGEKKKLNIGVIGYGFTGRTHSTAFGKVRHWWVPGLQIGYEHTFIHQAADFIDTLESGTPAAPTFRDGFTTDQVTAPHCARPLRVSGSSRHTLAPRAPRRELSND